jgi:hypothetical protein
MGMEHDTTAASAAINKGEHSMRTWINNGLRLPILMTALAGTGMACSATSADRFSRQADQAGDQQNPVTPGTGDGPADGPAGTALSRRVPVAGLIGLTVTLLGAGMLIRRRRRAGSQGEA